MLAGASPGLQRTFDIYICTPVLEFRKCIEFCFKAVCMIFPFACDERFRFRCDAHDNLYKPMMLMFVLGVSNELGDRPRPVAFSIQYAQEFRQLARASPSNCQHTSTRIYV